MSQKKFFSLDDPRDIEILQKLMFDDEEDKNPSQVEDFEDDADTDTEVMPAEERIGNSDTEESGTDDEPDPNEDLVYIGKDKTTKWRKMQPKKCRTQPQNIITRLPGVIREARQAKLPIECWANFFSNEMLQKIVQYTNQYIRLEVRDRFERERDANDTDIIEIRAFIGLLYLAGTLHANRIMLEDLWGTDGYGIEIFRLTMSLRRFKFLVRCLRFDDRTTRNERKSIDKIAAIRQLFDAFVSNCKNSYSVGRCVTIDEKLESFRGRCSFKQYIPSKPAKYGVKIYALCDAAVFYTYNLEIYPGRQPEGQYQLSNKPADVVKRLAQPIYGTGRNITADNWFSDVQLAAELKEHRLSYVGTLKKNKRALPLDLLNVKGRPLKSSIFGFGDNCTIVSYVPKKNKNIVLISTQHFDDAIDEESGDAVKPQMITYYNKTKSGVDVVDKLCASYNVARNIRRWPMVIFFAMLNISGINAQVISIGNGQENMRRRLFLRKLGHELVLPHLQRRSVQIQGIPFTLTDALRRFRPPVNPEEEVVAEELEAPPTKRRRCALCYTLARVSRLTKTICKNCKRSICGQHTTAVCPECYPRLQEKDDSASDD